MELYVLSKQDLSILSVCKLADWQINLDEETNAKSTFSLMKTEGLIKDNFLVLNGLYKQFLFIIDEVQTEKGSNLSTVTALDISNIFDRKVIEKNIDDMKNESIEKFLAETISDNFVNSDDTYLNVGYIDIYWHTNTQGTVATNAENGLYNFHTFLTNCRQYKNIYTDFQFVDGRLRIDIRNKQETTKLIDTTLPEVTDYNKIYENDITAKVTVFIRENGNEYNLYLRTDRSTTTNKDDPNRASGKIEVISVDTEDRAAEEALNVMKGNNYKHLVEFKIAKTSKTMDISEFTIGRPVRIKTEDDIYDSYISAITMSDENFVYFKSGSLRNTLIDKLKSNENKVGNKLDVSGGKITGSLSVAEEIYKGNKSILDLTYPVGSIYISVNSANPSQLFGGTWQVWGSGKVPVGIDRNQTEFNTVEKTGGEKTHTLTIEEMPNHNHNIMDNKYNYTTGGSAAANAIVLANADATSLNVRTNNTGGGQSHNILQPYITCYMWKRTA